MSNQKNTNNFLVIHKSSLSSNLLAIVIILVALASVRLPVFSLFSTHYIGSVHGDAGLYVWLIKHHIEHLFTTSWFQTTAFYPYSDSLAWSDNFILPGIVAIALNKLGFGLPTIYNLIFISATFLTGFLTYYLAYNISSHFIGAISAAVAFMCSSYVSAMLGHPQLQFTFFFPLALIFLFRFISFQTFINSTLFGLTISLCFITTVYYSIFIVVLALAVITAMSLVRPGWITKLGLAKLIVGGCVGLLPAIPFILPYLRVRETFGERALYEAYYFAASALSYISSPASNLLFGATSSLSHEEGHLLPGYILLATLIPSFYRLFDAKPLKRLGLSTLLLFLLAFLSSALASQGNSQIARYENIACAVLLWLTILSFGVLIYRMGLLERKLNFHILTNRALFSIFIFSALIIFAISLGPLGNPSNGEFALGIHRLFYTLLPGFNSIRATARIGVVVIFLLSLNLALALTFLTNRFPKYSKVWALLPLIIILENYNKECPLEPLMPPPAAYLSIQPEERVNSAIITLPLTTQLNERGEPKHWTEFARLQVESMLNAVGSGWNTVNGYSGQRSKIMREWPRELAGFPDLRSVQALCSVAGLRYVIYQTGRVADFDQLAFIKRTANLSKYLKYVDADAGGNFIFQLPCETQINDRTYLLAPSNSSGVIPAELMALQTKEEGMFAVQVTTRDENGDEILVTEISLKANGEYAPYSIPVPLQKDRVRPIKLTFKFPRDKVIYLKNTRYQSLS